MKPGRELDLLIAEKIMGLEIADSLVDELEDYYPTYKVTDDEDWSELPVPKYSTDIAAAWKVVEKMKNNHWPFYLANYDNKWSCQFAKDSSHAISDQVPHAICLAALKAKGVEIETE